MYMERSTIACMFCPVSNELVRSCGQDGCVWYHLYILHLCISAVSLVGTLYVLVQSIQNPKVIPILLNWISDLDHPQCVMVLDQLNQLIPGSVFNKHQCCREGAIATILSVLGNSQTEQTYLGQDVEGWTGLGEGVVFRM